MVAARVLERYLIKGKINPMAVGALVESSSGYRMRDDEYVTVISAVESFRTVLNRMPESMFHGRGGDDS